MEMLEKKRAIKKVIKGLGKAVKAHTKQKKMLQGVLRAKSNSRSAKS
jgi:hypothetical protein